MLKVRVSFDNEQDDIYREVIVSPKMNFEDFGNYILNIFGIEANEITSFSVCDKNWDKIGDDITMFEDFSDRVMSKTLLGNIFKESKNLIYTFDMLNNTIFLIEIEGQYTDKVQELPFLLSTYGEMPDLTQYEWNDEFNEGGDYEGFDDDDDSDDDYLDDNDLSSEISDMFDDNMY